MEVAILILIAGILYVTSNLAKIKENHDFDD